MVNKSATKEFNFPDFINLPHYLYLDDRLEGPAKIMAGFFCSLHHANRSIKASTEYLCALIQVKKRQLYKIFNQLEALKYISRSGSTKKRIIKWVYELSSKTIVTESETTSALQDANDLTSALQDTKLVHSSAPNYCTGVHIDIKEDTKAYKDLFLEPKPEKQKTCAQLLNTETKYKKQELIGLENLTYERRIEHTIKACAQDEECKTEFEAKFSAYDVTYQRMLEECTSHYTTQAKLFDRFKFLDWIRNTDPQRKGYKTKLQTKKESSFTYANLNKKQIELVQNLHWEKMHPDLEPKLKSLERAEGLRLVGLLDAANETIPYEVYSEEEKKTVNLMNGQAARLIISEVLKQSPAKMSEANRMALLGSIGRRIN